MQSGSIPTTASTLGIYAIQPPRPGSPPVTDPKDGNRDGLVSFGEAWTYSIKHPEINIIKELRTLKEPILNINHEQNMQISAPVGSTALPISSWGAAKGGLVDLLA